MCVYATGFLPLDLKRGDVHGTDLRLGICFLRFEILDLRFSEQVLRLYIVVGIKTRKKFMVCVFQFAFCILRVWICERERRQLLFAFLISVS